MKSFTLYFALLVFPFLSQAQFDTSAYHQVSQGADPNNVDHAFVIIFKSNANPAYRLEKVYSDSAYKDLQSKTFYKDSLPEGPYTAYVKGKVGAQGAYKAGKLDGECLTYVNDTLVQKAYYINGVRTGTWEEYSKTGQLRRRISYDSSGKIVSDVRY